MNEIPQAQFSGWAKVEVMGHQTHIGFVRTEAYGQAVLFRIDTPELPEREYELERPEWCGQVYAPAGTKVQRPAEPGVSVLIGAGSIYRIIPCTEEAARKAIESNRRAELKLVALPPGKTLAAAAAVDLEDDDQDDDDPYEDDTEDDIVRPGLCG